MRTGRKSPTQSCPPLSTHAGPGASHGANPPQVTLVSLGAAGTIGTALAAALTAEAIAVRLLDIRPHHRVAANAQAQRVELRELWGGTRLLRSGGLVVFGG